MNRFLLLAAVAGIALAVTACGPATPTTTAGTGAGAGAGGSSEPPTAPTPTPDPDPPPAPAEPMRWTLEADHFGDDDATIWAQTSNRSTPFEWERITAANRGAVSVSIGGQPLPITNVAYEPAFADDFSGAEWKLAAEVTEGAVVLVLTAQNQRRNSDKVASVTLTSGGSGYTSAPTVSFTGVHANPALATATAADQVASVTITNGGHGYGDPSPVGVQDYDVTFSGGGGSGAAAKTSARWVTVGSVSIPATGNSGYTSVPTITLSAGSGTGATATAVGPTGVRSIGIGTGGAGYTAAPTVTCPTPTGGRAATGTGVLTSGVVSSVTITDPGVGYTSGPICTFQNTGSTQATGAASTLEDSITSVTITNAGVGYATLPTCAVTGTATCVANYGTGMSQAQLRITNPGSGYTSAPTPMFPEPPPGGMRAVGTAALTDAVTSLTLTDGGSGYKAVPTVEITGGGGTGATAVAELKVTGNTEFDNLYWARQTLYGKELVIEIAEATES